MGLVYLSALVTALGVLFVQIAFGRGGHGLHHAGGGHGHGAHGAAQTGAGALFAMLASTRFWIFALLGFGLSGSMLHWFGHAGPEVTLGVAIAAGLGAGVGASLAFRAALRSSVGTPTSTASAIGKVATVVVACAPKKQGMVRIELAGSSVDMIAETEEESEIERGARVVVHAVENGTARVTRFEEDLG